MERFLCRSFDSTSSDRNTLIRTASDESVAESNASNSNDKDAEYNAHKDAEKDAEYDAEKDAVEDAEEEDNLIADDFLERTETSKEFRRRVFSLTVSFGVLTLMVIQSSIYLTSLWPYLQAIDPQADETFFGLIIMVYNLAGVISSPFFGWWTNKIRSSKVPIMAGLVLNTFGNLLLAFVGNFDPTNRKWIILVARVISGFGAGNRAALYAFIAMSSKQSEMSKIISYRSAITSAAIMFGPGIQAAMVPIGYPGYIWGPIRLDMYTAPALLSLLLGLVALIVMTFGFTETWLSVAEVKNEAGEYEELEMTPYDPLVLVVCGFVRFAQVFSFTFDDVIGSPLTMVMFGWSKSEAITYNGLVIVAIGFIDIFGQLIVGNFVLKWIRERTLILLGLVLMLGFLLVVYPWPGLPPMIADDGIQQNYTDPSDSTNTTLLQNISQFPVSTPPSIMLDNKYTTKRSITTSITLNATITSINGTAYNTSTCDYAWCPYTPRINLAQYLVAFLFLAASVSTAYTPTATLFSKALGPRRQGTWQWYFSACGMMGMTLSPPIASFLFKHEGPRVMWAVGFVLLLTSIVPFLVTFKRLVAWSEKKDKELGGGKTRNPRI